MTISRSRLVDTSVSRWYHCISVWQQRCQESLFWQNGSQSWGQVSVMGNFGDTAFFRVGSCILDLKFLF